MADLSKIKFPGDNTVYNIKDATARSDIANLQTILSGAMYYIGITTTVLTDGCTTTPITIDGDSVAPEIGAVAIYGELEFVWNGTKWQEFGSTGSLKALAFKDNASGSYTPVGTVSQPSFTGNAASIEISITPGGTVSQPTFTGTPATITSNSYTPSGTIELTSTSPSGSSVANYTPAGTISQPTTTVSLNTTTVNSITSVGTLPSCTLPVYSASVSNELLTISWTAGSFSAGTLPTKGTDTIVATGVASASTTAPTFTGTGAVLSATFSGAATTISSNYTPQGTVSQPTFAGTNASGTMSYTPTGTVSQPTFTGSADTITVS